MRSGKFDLQHPDFIIEPRNVRLELVVDGFNPFGNMNNNYNMWPVILIPYNLPPWLVIKVSYFMLSLLISGPHQLGNKIDIYLKPMVDELKELWEDGQKLTMPIVKRISRCMQLCCRQYMTIQDLVTCLGKGQRIIILVTFATTNHIQNIWKVKLDSLTIEPIWLWTAK